MPPRKVPATGPATPPPLRLEWRDADELLANPRNWRTHPPAQRDALAAVMKRTGWAGALLLNETTGHLVDGHARRELYAGQGKVPVLVGRWSEDDEAQLLALFDSVGTMAQTDAGAVDALLGAITQEADAAVTKLFDSLSEVLAPPMRVEVVRVEDLTFHPRNYRKHPADQLEHLAASIREHGFYRNVVIARDNTVLAGQGVVQAARYMGLERVPVVRLNVDANERRALKVMAGDNEIARLAEVDPVALTTLLSNIVTAGGRDLNGTGYDALMLSGLALVTRAPKDIPEVDEAGLWGGMPEFDNWPQHSKLFIAFRSPEAREAFLAEFGLKVAHRHRTTFSAWFPAEGRDDVSAVRFEGEA